MLKHVGKHSNKKVVIIYNTVPGEDHMGLVVYSENLPQMLHDAVMGVVESEVGQKSQILAEALFRHTMPDGNNALNTLHTGGFIKKVQTKQVILTPNAKSTVRLDELNEMLKKMEGGQDAIEKLRALDEGRGFRDPQKTTSRDVGEPAVAQQAGGALSDADIAQNLREQANGMRAQVKVLLAEADRLESEANDLVPSTKKQQQKKVTATKAKNVRSSKKATA